MSLSVSEPSELPTSSPKLEKSFVKHAKLISFLTTISRFFGLGREIVATHYLGTELVGSAFAVAFVIPNLFRKLFGEGALSAAFIPLYSQAIKSEKESDGSKAGSANDFAAAAVNLLFVILLGLTIVGEGIIYWLLHFGHDFRPAWMLTLRLTAIMLPYVLLICGGAFLSGILQVHKRFGPPAAAPIILNACHIIVLLIGAKIIGLGRHTPADLVEAKQIQLSYWLAVVVLIAGAMQVGVLLPALKEIGFRFKLVSNFWTPPIKKMLLLSLPVAMGAGVLQLSVMLDKSISMALMTGKDDVGKSITTFHWFGKDVRLPMELGAPRRLDLAQNLYQFPLGIFAIALATAIFPGLSADALDKDREKFRGVLRHGIEASLWEGLPASLGLILVAEPTARLMFQHGETSAHHATLIAQSTMIYASAIWAFSLLQIINRAYYAIHDTITPLVMSIVNIIINLVVELPLVWTKLGESGMAVGTVVSFAIQALVMLWMLDRKIGGLDLRRSFPMVMKMLLGTVVMGIACYGVKLSPAFPHGDTRIIWASQIFLLLSSGAAVYLGMCYVLHVNVLADLLPKRFRKG